MTWLRSAAFNVWFFGMTTVLVLASLPLRALAPGRAMDLVRLWARLALGGLRLLCGIRWEVAGGEHVPMGAALIASQHQSAFDTIIWFLIAREPTYVLKKELLRIPLFGPLCHVSGMIPVDRSAGAAAVRDLVRAGAQAADAGRQIVIFPEGTRVEPGAQVQLQPGIAALATRTGLPVLPVITDSGQYWGRRAFRKHPGTIHIRVLPPLPAGLARPALLDALRTAYAQDPAGREIPVDNSVDMTTAALRPRLSGSS
jgi:1-acyl-sn-glycerol-3-phosphate acyltransferase